MAARVPVAPPADTFLELVELYLGKHARRKKRTWKEDAPQLAKDLLNVALDCEWIDANPAGRLKRRSVEVSRERVLTDDEIRQLWQALAAAAAPHEAVADDGRRITVGRREDVDNDSRVWVVPATVAKKKIAHVVPLPPGGRRDRRASARRPRCRMPLAVWRTTATVGPAKDRAKDRANTVALGPPARDGGRACAAPRRPATATWRREDGTTADQHSARSRCPW
jgi:integrase